MIGAGKGLFMSGKTVGGTGCSLFLGLTRDVMGCRLLECTRDDDINEEDHFISVERRGSATDLLISGGTGGGAIGNLSLEGGAGGGAIRILSLRSSARRFASETKAGEVKGRFRDWT